jgi:hypothetical protein
MRTYRLLGKRYGHEERTFRRKVDGGLKKCAARVFAAGATDNGPVKQHVIAYVLGMVLYVYEGVQCSKAPSENQALEYM